MKKWKKLFLSFAGAIIILGSLGACGAGGNTKTDGDQERDKITVLLRSSETGNKYKILKKMLTEFSKEKGLKEPEFELISSDADYLTKLQLYINSDTLPDIYGAANGALSDAAQQIDAMVNIGEELKRIDMYDQMNEALIDFFADAKDGEMYLFPEALYTEYFVYRKDIFEKYNLTPPTTWEEFLKISETLKEKGEIPLIVAGKDNWVLMRYLSFAPWRVTYDKFITGYINGEESFQENKAAQYGVELLHTLGTKGYFQPGFMSTDYNAAHDVFYGGTGAMMYTGSGTMYRALDMYDEGKLGLFPVPAVEGEENIPTNTPIHGGFGTAFNAKTYDKTMQEFFEYMCENYTDEAFNTASVFSPFKGEMPKDLHPMFYEIKPMIESATEGWVSWDDKLDSAVLTDLVTEQQKLAQGTITPEEFEKKADSFIQK
ncbi:ABC transporter substrate-binding protein [Lederbergia sp. NSJ-179]|uniref:ABC transporter substrate-binding protein n=1 Tax=Lederbergia sp. NSJ-179 TaxID=2931402 RepID=UPI001FD5B712|nr:ABC transporter substrate-binding protein [Lederbergia sp. NSJ-179]MCJ7842127.1 ABC transporter substrate-binding protein [Lederbergia sp. NSJ-179]